MPGDHAYSKLSMTMSAGTLKAIGRLNVPLYRLSRGRIGGRIGRAPVLLLTSIGRRSNQPRTAPVLYMRDSPEVFVVIGSNAGNRNEPGWSFNLKANPEAEIEVGGDHRLVRARVAEGEERERLWKAMNTHYEGFEDYEARTDRDIAVFVLEPR